MLEEIRARRSIRNFEDYPVSEEHRAALEEAALRSPTARNLHSWEFVFVDDRTLLRALANVKPSGGEFLATAPLAMVVFGDPTLSDCWIEDGSIAAIMVQLAASSLGLGTCWVQIRGRTHADGHPSSEHVRRLLSAPARLEALVILAIGHPAERKPPRPAKELPRSKIHRNGF